jgi:hypothetical protein
MPRVRGVGCAIWRAWAAREPPGAAQLLRANRRFATSV